MGDHSLVGGNNNNPYQEAYMLTALFWKDAFERAVKTAAQALLSLWLVGDVAFNLFTVDWGSALGVAAGAAVISLLTSIASGPVGDRGTASLVSSGSRDEA